ncbi:MAG: ParB N-terminal domain-containing protein [Desulfobulbaceae bacterium]|nr:ParB N-terminal domain-containing protein [Desulfobulbaceae bacterium]
MKTTPAIRPINISSIDRHDAAYLLSPRQEYPDAALRESVRRYGILFPPLLLERDRDRFVILSGRKRIQAALEAGGSDSIPCLVIPGNSPPLFVYTVLLEHAMIGGSLSPAQQVAFFSGLLRDCPLEDGLPLFAKLGHPPHRHRLIELLSLRDLAPAAMTALHQGILSLGNARKIITMAPGDQTTLVGLITRLRLGGSRQQKLIELCIELIMRRNEDLQTVLQPFLSGQEAGQPENVPQQAAALLKWLHNEAFPRSSTAEQQFDRFAHQLELPANIRILHTPAFEDETVTLCLDFPDRSALREAWERIRKLV